MRGGQNDRPQIFYRDMKRLFPLLLLTIILFACAPKPDTWWHDAVFYEVFVRSFYDSNGDGIGDFNGLTQKLDYLNQLGINAIWLMPIHPSPSYHGYDVTDYYAVNPEYGTMDDFKNFLSAAHKRNMRVIIDLVLNHTSSQHPFFTDALQGSQSKYYNWYVWSNTDQGMGWHSVSGTNSLYYFGYFCDCMPDLNYRNPDVTHEMENVARFWLNDIGVDGFRVDAVNRLIEEGNKLENTKSTHDWLKGFYQSYKSDNPNAYTIGEVFGADASLAKTYTGDQLDEVFNFEISNGILNSIKGGSNVGINSALTFATQSLPDASYGTFLTNHDQNRTMSQLSGDVNKAKLAAFLLLASPGTPFIYYGEEIGMQGEKPDEDIRLPMQWSADANGGFTTGTPWRAPFTNYSTVNVAAEINDPTSLLSLYKNLIALRTSHSALRTGSLTLLDSTDNHLFVSLRSDKSETLFIIANLSGDSILDFTLSAKETPLRSGQYTLDPLFGSGNFTSLQIDSNGGFANFKPLTTIPPYGMYILKVK